MTDDAFEAFWFLYQSSQETLRDLAVRAARTGDKKSHITYFNEAIQGALNRSNNTDEFIKAIEQSLDLRFYQTYSDPLPSSAAMATLFKELKQHGTLAFMPRLVERVQKRKETADEQEDTGGDA
jgi:hypothetical protein